MSKPEKVQKKKISLTKLLVFRLCVNTSIKNILGFCWDFFFPPSLERQYFIQIFIHMFPFFQKRKTSKVAFTGCGNILDKEIFEISLVVGYAFIINKLVTKFIFFPERKVSRVYLQASCFQGGEIHPLLIHEDLQPRYYGFVTW